MSLFLRVLSMLIIFLASLTLAIAGPSRSGQSNVDPVFEIVIAHSEGAKDITPHLKITGVNAAIHPPTLQGSVEFRFRRDSNSEFMRAVKDAAFESTTDEGVRLNEVLSFVKKGVLIGSSSTEESKMERGVWVQTIDSDRAGRGILLFFALRDPLPNWILSRVKNAAIFQAIKIERNGAVRGVDMITVLEGGLWDANALKKRLDRTPTFYDVIADRAQRRITSPSFSPLVPGSTLCATFLAAVGE